LGGRLVHVWRIVAAAVSFGLVLLGVATIVQIGPRERLGAGSTSVPNVLTITRTDGPISVSHETITTAPTVRALYMLLLQLPSPPRSGLRCPTNAGVVYSLVFYHDSRVILPAIVHPSGCETVLLGTGQTVWALGAAGSAFLDLLAHAARGSAAPAGS